VTRVRRLGMLGFVVRCIARMSLALSLVAASGCSSGTETGNPPFQAELSYTAYSSEPESIGVRDPGRQAVVDSAWLDLDAVTLRDASSCAAAAPTVTSVPALGIGDHAAGQHNATRFSLSGGEYCGLDLPFVLAPAAAIRGAVPPDLEQHSIMLAGALADGTRFTLLSAATPTVRLVADASRFEISAEHAQTLIAFDVAAWLGDLDWASAVRSGGAIQISADANSALLTQFESRLARGVALYRDADGDGQLDANAERLAHGD